MTTSGLRWARGWLIASGAETDVPPGWSALRLGAWILLSDEKTQVGLAKGDASWAAVIGHAIAPSLGESDSDVIAGHLLKLGTVEEMQDFIDTLVGRFVLAVSRGGRTILQQDAVGLRAVYYAHEGRISAAASHASLVASLVDAGPGTYSSLSDLRRYNLRTFPGWTTPFQGVSRLTPNLELNLLTGHVSRIFPRQPRQRMSADEAADVIIDRSVPQAETFQRSGRPKELSLTAGLDSRVSLALLGEVRDLNSFTYEFPMKPTNRANEHDTDVAIRLASIAGIQHRVLRVTDDAPRDFRTTLDQNWPVPHSRPLAYAYTQQFPPNVMHIRSNAYGIGLGYYRRAGFDAGALTPELMLRISSSKKQGRGSYALQSFAAYASGSDFSSIEENGYDPYDFLLWEIRVGAWLASALHESDSAFDSHVLINSREMLRAMLSVPLQQRMGNAVPQAIVRRLRPHLLSLPVNGRMM